jgi:hypothetical protein
MKTDIDAQLKAGIEAMIRSGLTRYAVAKGAGVDYATLMYWLDSDRDIRLSTATAIARFAGLELRKK